MAMKIHEILDRDPRQSPLANNGQARITTDQDERALRELRAELETFVCDGEYATGIERILRSYLTQLDRPRQNAAWVSGFFGSGKSHLLKLLGHLWVDTEFPDGTTARSLVRGLPDKVTELLRELDMQVKRSRKPAFAAAGSMPSGTNDQVRLTVLSIVLRACGLPETYPQAQFCLWLRERGYLDRVRGAVETAGKDWARELSNLYVSGVIANAVLAVDSGFARDEREARQVLRDRFKNPTSDLTTSEFLSTFREAIGSDGQLPLTIIVLDEVQQYLGDSNDRSTVMSELAEAIQTQLDSRVLLVASGQSALSDKTQYLLKLKDRFRVTVQLSEADIEAVTRKVLLAKKQTAVEPVREILDRNAGEVSNHLQGTRLAERSEDLKTRVVDYPLLPTRRRFWEECFRFVDQGGTHSQLRSQLRILHDVLHDVADRDLGAVIPSEVLFDALSGDMLNTGVLLNEIATRIKMQDDNTADGRLRRRICGLVFLINKLPREGPAETGVRATPKMIADLMVDDIEADSGRFRKSIETALEKLAADGTLMKVGEEYRLQTTEGAEWDRAYRERVAALRQQESDVALKRDQLLGAAVQNLIRDIRPRQGDSKVARAVELHVGMNEPSADALSRAVIIWLRDAWSTQLKEIENEARRRGHEDPVVHLYLPRKSAKELETAIIEADGARQVVDAKGVPSTREGEEARESMQSRLRVAETVRDELIREIVAASRVYLGGGSEQFDESLPKKLDAAVEASLARQYSRFGDGDHRAWEVALKRALQGGDAALVAVGWDKPTEDHPVAREILARVASGMRGSDVRKALGAPPFGWARDAVDAVLAALLRSGTLRATLNGQPVSAAHLDQTKIGTAEFRLERVRLGTADKLALRGLYQQAGIGVRSGEEEEKARPYLDRLAALAAAAGGEAPLPLLPNTSKIEELKALAGSEQLGAILAARESLERCAGEWQETGRGIEERRPAWESLERLLAHASDLATAREMASEVEAIKRNRALLAEPDPVAPLRARLGASLRAALTEQAEAYRAAHVAARATLESDGSWRQLDEPSRRKILGDVGLAEPVAPTMKSDAELLCELDRSGLDTRKATVAAVKERVARALESAARRTKPDAKRVHLRTATLETEADVNQWIDEHLTKLLAAVAEGPVIVG